MHRQTSPVVRFRLRQGSGGQVAHRHPLPNGRGNEAPGAAVSSAHLHFGHALIGFGFLVEAAAELLRGA